MKRLIFTITICFILVSCGHEECGTLFISNETGKNIIISFFTDKNVVKTVDIQLNQREELFPKSCADGESLLPDINVYDSIHILNSIDSVLLKSFTVQTPSKNFFNWKEDWIIESVSRRDYEYTFEITEEDIDNLVK